MVLALQDFRQDRDGSLYVTTSQIHRIPRFNGGKNERIGPFASWRILLPPKKAWRRDYEVA